MEQYLLRKLHTLNIEELKEILYSLDGLSYEKRILYYTRLNRKLRLAGLEKVPITAIELDATPNIAPEPIDISWNECVRKDLSGLSAVEYRINQAHWHIIILD